MGIFDKGPIKDETVTLGREGHFGRREARDNRNGYISQLGGEIDLGNWNDIKDAVRDSDKGYKW
jgi:hypothetical protein